MLRSLFLYFRHKILFLIDVLFCIFFNLRFKFVAVASSFSLYFVVLFCFHLHHLFTFVGHKSGSKIQTGQTHTHTHICIDFYTCTLLNQTYIGVYRYVCWYIAMYIIQCYAHSFSWIAEKTTTTTRTFDVYDTMTLNHWILGCWCCCCFFFCFRLYVFVSFVIYTPQFLVGRFFC